MTSPVPADAVVDFLDAMVGGDIETVVNAVADDIVYTNVGLPTVHGRKQFAKVFGLLGGGRLGFDYRMLAVASNDGVVLTERIDELSVGPLRFRFWVCGRFEVADGVITVWRDYFDFWDCTKATVRGIVGLLIPAALPKLPPRLTSA